MKKKILSVCLVFTLILGTMMPAAAADTWIWGEGSDYTGQDCTSDLTAASTINYLMQAYPDGSTWTLGGECWGFAQKVNEYLSGEGEAEYFTGLENTRENFIKTCLGVKAGTHIRFNYSEAFDDWSGHSVVLLSVTEDKVYWADNNYDRANTVHYYSGTIDDFFSMYGQYGYLTMVKEPVKYKAYKTTQAVAESGEAGNGIKLTWLRTTHTKEYQVYRSYTGTGKFKRIASTKKKTYTDTTADADKTVYYKIKSIRSNGNTVSSPVFCGNFQLETPENLTGTVNEKNHVTFTWDPVEHADSYVFYCRREKDGPDGDYFYDTTVEGKTTYIDTNRKPKDDRYYYKIAAYHKASNTYSELSDWLLI